jgi:hypothetical protein
VHCVLALPGKLLRSALDDDHHHCCRLMTIVI